MSTRNGLPTVEQIDEVAPAETTFPEVTPRCDIAKRTRPKGYHDWKPRPAAAAIIEDVKEILDEYQDHLPMTVRQIFYRMVGAYDFPKDERAYRSLQEKLNLARRAKMIPFSAIRDDGIIVMHRTWHEGPADFWDDVGNQANRYRRDRQVGQPARIELWAESAGMLPQLAKVASQFSVPVYSAGGSPSVTANYDVADRVLQWNVPTIMLHVGDFDPSGVSIFESMVADVAAFVEADRLIQNIHVEPVRVALTADQVAAYQLPTSPAKKTDSRSAKWKGETCQLEGLAPDDLAEIVDDAIRSRMIPSKLDEQIMLEESERIALLRSLPDGSSA